jgi:hypothetical protein
MYSLFVKNSFLCLLEQSGSLLIDERSIPEVVEE